MFSVISYQFQRPAFLFFFAAPEPPPNALALSFFCFAFSAFDILLFDTICFFAISTAAFCSLRAGLHSLPGVRLRQGCDYRVLHGQYLGVKS